MTGAAERPRIDVDGHLAGDHSSAAMHEHLAGEVFAMAGPGGAHVTAALDLATILRSHARGGPCRVHISDM